MTKLIILVILLLSVGCAEVENSGKILRVKEGMHVRIVDSIMGEPDYIQPGSELIDSNWFGYFYYAGLSASSDLAVFFDKTDSLVVDVAYQPK